MNERRSAPKQNGSAPIKISHRRLSPEVVAQGIRHLQKADPVLGAAIRAVGAWRLKHGNNHFHALARAIVYQQISGHAARTIWGRVTALSTPEKFTADSVMRLTDDQLRGAGLSPQKVRYMR